MIISGLNAVYDDEFWITHAPEDVSNLAKKVKNLHIIITWWFKEKYGCNNEKTNPLYVVISGISHGVYHLMWNMNDGCVCVDAVRVLSTYVRLMRMLFNGEAPDEVIGYTMDTSGGGIHKHTAVVDDDTKLYRCVQIVDENKRCVIEKELFEIKNRFENVFGFGHNKTNDVYELFKSEYERVVSGDKITNKYMFV